jgi:glycosyltransferase involved in cell wall biosynthesis
MTGVLEERIQVVPLGVSETFRPAPLEQVKEIRRRYALEDPYLLVVGSLEPRKNLARLFRAWELIYNKTTANVLAVAGVSGRNFRDAGFAAAPAGVQFLGYAAEDGLPALYSGASGLVFPSVYEGFGLPALEAMACGTPVIASRAASLPEVVGDAGLLFDPFDVEEMSEAIATLLEDTGLRDELRQRGLARARQFSWEATTQMTWEVLCQACEDED